MTSRLSSTVAFVCFFLLLGVGSIVHAQTYSYDDAGRLTGVAYDDGSAIAYTYDANGNRLARTVTVPDVVPPVITLLGANPMTVVRNTAFVDPGSTVTDNVDTGLVAIVTGTVDTTTDGTYVLSYNVSDAAGNAAVEVTRTVNVVAGDTEPPVITLVGDNPMSVEQNTTFSDPGATVTDNVDTGLTAVVTGTVDTVTLGAYSLSYNASDAAGNVAVEVVRTVNVVAAGTGPGDPATPPTTSKPDSGCGCAGAGSTDAGSSPVTANIMLGLGLLGLAHSRRKRRQARR